MIKSTYIGAFIVPELKDFHERTNTDEFYEGFVENGKFRTAYQGLETIDVLIPTGDDYAIRDWDDKEEYIITDFSELATLELKLEKDYLDTISSLRKLYPDGTFKIQSGVVSYWDEVA